MQLFFLEILYFFVSVCEGFVLVTFLLYFYTPTLRTIVYCCFDIILSSTVIRFSLV